MPYPPKPATPYDYTSFQADQPTTPLPAHQVANDFNTHKQSIDQTIDFLKATVRSDNKISAGMVPAAAFAADARALIAVGGTPRGSWATATSYKVSDLVEMDSESFIAVTAHTSTDFAIDRQAGKWLVLSSASISGVPAVALDNYAALRLYSGAATTATLAVRADFADGLGAVFDVDPDDTVSVDDDARIIVDVLGRRWRKRDTLDNVRVGPRWWGAKGDNIAIDDEAFANCIDYVNAQTFPCNIYVAPGQYKLTMALPVITRAVVIEGDNPRSAVLVPYGNFDFITFKSTVPGVRVANCGLRNIMIYGDFLTGGNALVVDFAQNVIVEDVIISNPFNGVHLRQVGDVQFVRLNMQPIRGQHGIKAYGTGTDRNDAGAHTQKDKIDVIGFTHCTIQNAPITSLANSTADLVWLDGWVHTVNIGTLRLLCGKRGLRLTNTPAAGAFPDCPPPAFINGFDLEIENPYLECVRGEALNMMKITGGFFVGSQTENGLYFGAGAYQLGFIGCKIEGNSYHGAQFDGSGNISMVDCNVYRNSQVGSGLKSGVYLGSASVGSFCAVGGNFGKAKGVPDYSELQKYGIDVESAANAAVVGVDLTGNLTGAYSGTISVIADSVLAGVIAGAATAIGFSGRSRIKSPADGQVTLLNAAETGFTVLQLGGTTSAFSGLRGFGTTLAAVLADGSAVTDFLATYLSIADGETAPGATAGRAKIYVDAADGDLKVKFGDGTTKTIVTDT